MENLIEKIRTAYLEMDNIPIDKFEDDYQKDKIINEVYNMLIECEHKIKQITD